MKARRECAGENILELAGGAEDLLSVVLCMKKLKGETKTDNMPTVNKEDDRVKAYTAWHHGSCCCECSEWSVLWRGQSWTGEETGVRAWLEGMQIDN